MYGIRIIESDYFCIFHYRDKSGISSRASAVTAAHQEDPRCAECLFLLSVDQVRLPTFAISSIWGLGQGRYQGTLGGLGAQRTTGDPSCLMHSIWPKMARHRHDGETNNAPTVAERRQSSKLRDLRILRRLRGSGTPIQFAPSYILRHRARGYYYCLELTRLFAYTVLEIVWTKVHTPHQNHQYCMYVPYRKAGCTASKVVWRWGRSSIRRDTCVCRLISTAGVCRRAIHPSLDVGWESCHTAISVLSSSIVIGSCIDHRLFLILLP